MFCANYTMLKKIYRDRLIANDFIQMHKVAEHVYEKVLGPDTGAVAVTSNLPGVERSEDQDNGSLAEEKVELLCNDQVKIFVCCQIVDQFLLVCKKKYITKINNRANSNNK